MRAALENIADMVSAGRADALTLPWQELRYQHTTAIRAALAERYAPATANKMLSALRGVVKECWRLGYIGAEERDRACDLSPVRGKTLPKGRSLTSGERKALFDWCAEDEKPARGARDAALLAVLYVCGLRRGEVPGLDLSDFDPGTGELRVRRGKGASERIVYAMGGAGEAIEGWIFHRGEEPGPLFWPVLKNGEPVKRRISDQTVYDILKRLRRARAPRASRRTTSGGRSSRTS
jgi:integrase